MGYNLIIGEKVIDDTDPEAHSYVWAKSVRLEEAPADGSPTDHTNERWPSYAGWGDFQNDCERHGGGEVIALIVEEHPGYLDITPDLNNKIQSLKAGRDYNKFRLEWLKFWAAWALKNCKNPVICNC